MRNRHRIGLLLHSWVKEMKVKGAEIEVVLNEQFFHARYRADIITTSVDGLRGNFILSNTEKVVKKKKQRVHFYNPEKYLS